MNFLKLLDFLSEDVICVRFKIHIHNTMVCDDFYTTLKVTLSVYNRQSVSIMLKVLSFIFQKRLKKSSDENQKRVNFSHKKKIWGQGTKCRCTLNSWICCVVCHLV